MRTKLPQLTDDEKIKRFKDCLISLDPAMALNEEFLKIKDFKKRYNAKADYYRFTPDNFRTIEARVNSTGTKVSLRVDTIGMKDKFNWYYTKREKNTEAVDLYKKFKENARLNKEVTLAAEIKRHKKLAILMELKNLIPEDSDISIEADYSAEETFTIRVSDLPTMKVEQIIQKIKDLV